jgi:serine/threonine protein kinase
MRTVKCQKCTFQNKEGHSVCARCGTPLPVVDSYSGLPDIPTPFSSSSSRSLELRKGQVLAKRYTIRKLIGRGGMGSIYSVYDNTLDEEMALKVLLPKFVEEKMVVERFFNEAKIARALSHPNIVRVHDIGTENNTIYISMELVKGRSLRELLDNMPPGQRLAVRSMLRIFVDLCTALTYAHQYTIHRDIKPENIMVDSKGKVKLMDFGISKLMTSSNITATSIVMGTPQYMAPEQLRNSAKVDARADLYSVGVMMYEVLVGSIPTAVIGTPRDDSNDIPPSIEPLIQKCLEQNPDKRYQNAHELREALRGVRTTLDTMRPTAMSTGQVRRWGLSRRFRRVLAVALLAVIATSISAGLWQAEAGRKALLENPTMTTVVVSDVPSVTPENPEVNPQQEFARLRGLITQASHRSQRELLRPLRGDNFSELVSDADKQWDLAEKMAEDNEYHEALELGYDALQHYLVPLQVSDQMVFIPGGAVELSNGTSDWVDAFAIEKHSVTAAQFRDFADSSHDWSIRVGQTDDASPKVNITYYDAQAYAASMGLRLPTEGQWRRAAAHLQEFGVGDPESPTLQELVLCDGLFQWTSTFSGKAKQPNEAERPYFGDRMIVFRCVNEEGVVQDWTEEFAFEELSQNVGFRCIQLLTKDLDALETVLRNEL